MGAELSSAAVLAYGIASGAYALFGGYLLFGWRGGAAGRALLVAVASSALWAFASTFIVTNPVGWINLLGWGLDVARQGCWLCFLVILLQPLGGARRRWPVLATTAVLLAELGAVINGGFDFEFGEATTKLLLGSFLGGAVLGLVFVEQLFRGMPSESRWGLKPLCLALSAGYIFELYLFADGFLFGRLDADVWGVRGVVHALTIPLIALSAGRNPAWTLHITVSREMVFHSTALALSGLYLLVIAGAGYYVRYVGGDWGRALQLALLFAGLLLLGVFLFSGAQRARLRVFINKHLFPYRYDYRKEWLRFTQALSAAGGTMDLGQSVIKALSDLVESAGGVLWLKDSGGRFTIHGHLNQVAPDAIEDGRSAFCHFLDEREWVINLEEFRARPAHYAGLSMPEWLSSMPDAWLVLPLKSAGVLVGFVVLNAPRTPFEVDWEVLDLLKTAQRQAASYLARMQAAEALLESRKFDSFNRMSAFVVHDLKNLVAQLSLMLKNAERHKHNPEFQEDMLGTVAHVESRMRALMAQLQEKRSIDPPRRVEMGALIERVQVAKRHHRPQVEVNISGEMPIEVLAHPERLERVIGHLVQNALDATPEDGKVVTRVDRAAGDSVRVLVEDSGCGMTKDFIRERLSRPFQTSKAGGMGLGVFEAQQYIQEIGGRLLFDSEPGRGTRVTVTLPAMVRDGGC